MEDELEEIRKTLEEAKALKDKIDNYKVNRLERHFEKYKSYKPGIKKDREWEIVQGYLDEVKGLISRAKQNC